MIYFVRQAKYITKPNYTQVLKRFFEVEIIIFWNGGVYYLLKMYTCGEIAERYGVKIITVWEWIRLKKLPAIRIGKEYRIKEEDLKEFEESRRTVRRGRGEQR